jgi:hypothetical protein
MEEQLTENDFSGIHAEPFEIQHHHAQHQQGELRHLCWFGMNLAPRFTDMQAQLKHLYCGCDPEEYSNFMISPIGQIDRKVIAS